MKTKEAIKAARFIEEVYHCEISETFLKELADKLGSKLCSGIL